MPAPRGAHARRPPRLRGRAGRPRDAPAPPRRTPAAGARLRGRSRGAEVSRQHVSTLAFKVREVHQHGSGGSHVVKYSAVLDLLVVQPFSVEILSIYPTKWASAEEVEVGRQMIQRGAVCALQGTGNAARIRVRDFVIHPVDFKPRFVEEYTFRVLRGVLGGAGRFRRRLTPGGPNHPHPHSVAGGRLFRSLLLFFEHEASEPRAGVPGEGRESAARIGQREWDKSN